MNVSQLIKSLEKTVTKLKTLDPKTNVIGFVDEGGYGECSMNMDLVLNVKKMRKGDESVEVVIEAMFQD